MKVSELSGDHVWTVHVPGQATPGTEDDWVALVAPWDLKVTGIKWVPNAAITANATNYFELQVLNGATTVATRTYDSGNSTALTAEDMALSATAADLELSAGDVLVVHKEVTGFGTGLAMPDGTIQVYAQGN